MPPRGLERVADGCLKRDSGRQRAVASARRLGTLFCRITSVSALAVRAGCGLRARTQAGLRGHTKELMSCGSLAAGAAAGPATIAAGPHLQVFGELLGVGRRDDAAVAAAHRGRGRRRRGRRRRRRCGWGCWRGH